jgi:hypothetical protein
MSSCFHNSCWDCWLSLVSITKQHKQVIQAIMHSKNKSFNVPEGLITLFINIWNTTFWVVTSRLRKSRVEERYIGGFSWFGSRVLNRVRTQLVLSGLIPTQIGFCCGGGSVGHPMKAYKLTIPTDLFDVLRLEPGFWHTTVFEPSRPQAVLLV